MIFFDSPFGAPCRDFSAEENRHLPSFWAPDFQRSATLDTSEICHARAQYYNSEH